MTGAVSSRFERLARKLTAMELRRADEDDERPAFVNTYSVDGLRKVIEHYGLHDKLVARGLGDYELAVTQEDPFHHRLELTLPPDGEHVMDLHVHLGRLTRADMASVDVVIVEWLLMQNPRAQFSAERPPLPGQKHPGTGLGKDVAQLLVLMCRRVHRAALVVVPERFHLAELYARAGWLAPSEAGDRLIDEVKLADPSLSFAERAWAMELGCVFDGHGDVVRYVPEERVLPVEDGVVPHDRFAWMRTLLAPRRRLHVDRDKLHEGMPEMPKQADG